MIIIQKQWNILSRIKKVSNYHNIIEYILRLRGVKDIQRFLNPSKKDLIDPFKLSNMKKAVSIILEGIRNNKRFSVFYDAADCDGLCAGTLMMKYLSNYTDNLQYLFVQGKKHGLKFLDLNNIIATTDILIVVDSSSEDYEQHKYLTEHGVEVVIFDHHEAKPSNWACIVNSQFDNYENSQLSGAGTTWKGCLAIDMITGNEYAEDYIDLACVGIIGDVMDLSESYPENRYIAKYGFDNLKNTALKTIIGNYDFNGTSVMYSIAPLLNSCARTGNNELAVKFLLEDDHRICKQYLSQIKELKKQQDKEVANIVNNLEFQIRNNGYDKNKVIVGFVESNEFAGLIGNKVSNKYQKPAIILHQPTEESEELKGSLRSFGLDNFKDIVNSTGLAKAFGHQGAAGVFLNKNNFNSFVVRLNELLKDVEFTLTQEADIVLNPEQITFELIDELEKVNRIVGHNFKPIQIVMEKVEPENAIIMQGKHTKFTFQDIEFIKWNDLELYEQLKVDPRMYVSLDVMGTLSSNFFRGKKTKQMILSDYKDIEIGLDFLRD